MKKPAETLEQFVELLNDFFKKKHEGSVLTLDFFLRESCKREIPEYEYNVDPTLFGMYNVHKHVDFLVESLFKDELEQKVLFFEGTLLSKSNKTYSVIRRDHSEQADEAISKDSLFDPHQPNKRLPVPEILEEMAKTFRERNKVYGSNYKMVGKLMAVLFPDGISKELLHSDHFHLFELILVKLSRFAISNLEHQDSIHDTAVYCGMIEAILKEKHEHQN